MASTKLAITASLALVIGSGFLACPRAIAGPVREADSASFPPYLDPAQGQWQVLSNSNWHVNGGAAKQVDKGPTTGRYPKGDKSFYIWAPACSRTAQTVDFTRTVDLPGPPGAKDMFRGYPGLTFFVRGDGSDGLHSLRSVDMTVNGHEVLHLDTTKYSGDPVDLNQGQRSAFVYGTNHLTISVTKQPTPKKNKVCYTLNYQGARTGVAFGLNGSSAYDLALVPFKGFTGAVKGQDHPCSEYDSTPVCPAWYYHFADGQPERKFVKAKLVAANNGPDAALGPEATQFGGIIGFSYNYVTVTYTLDKVDSRFACTSSQATTSISVHCNLKHAWAPVSNSSATVVFYVSMAQSPDDYSVFDFNFGVQPGNLKPANNSYRAVLIFCGTKATDAGCIASQPG